MGTGASIPRVVAALVHCSKEVIGQAFAVLAHTSSLTRTKVWADEVVVVVVDAVDVVVVVVVVVVVAVEVVVVGPVVPPVPVVVVLVVKH